MDDRTTRRRRPDWLRRDVGLGRNNGLLFWAHLVWGAGFALQVTLWTIYIQRLGATPGQIGLVVGGGAIVRTLLAIPAGTLADRVSPKPVIIGAMSAPVLGAIVLVMATEWWHALAGSILLDFSGIAIPAVSAYVAAAAPEGQRTRAYTYIFNLAIASTMTVLPALGGWIAEVSGFRIVYVLSGVCFAGGAAILLLIDDLHPDTRAENAADSSGAASWRELLALRWIWIVLAFHTLIPLFVYIGSTLQSNFLVEERNLSLATIGTLGSLGSMAGFGFALLVSHWRPLTRPFFGMFVCLVLMTVAFALLLTSGTLALIAVASMLRYSFSPIWSLMAASVADVTPERVRGRAYGLCELGVGIGDTSAPIAAGQIYAIDPRLPFVVSLVATAPLAAAAFVTHRVRQRAVALALGSARTTTGEPEAAS